MAQPQEIWLPFNSHLLRDEELQRKVFGIRWQTLYDHNRAALYAVSDAYKSTVRRSPPQTLIIRNGEVKFFFYNDTIWPDQPSFHPLSQPPPNCMATHLQANAQPGPATSGHFPVNPSAGHCAPQWQVPGNLNPAVPDFVPVRINIRTPPQPDQYQYQRPHQQLPQGPEYESNIHARMPAMPASRWEIRAPVHNAFEEHQTVPQQELSQRAAASSSSFQQNRDLFREIWQRQPPQSGADDRTIEKSFNRMILSRSEDTQRMHASNIEQWKDGGSAFMSPGPEPRGEIVKFNTLDKSYDTSGGTIWSSHMGFSSQVRDTSPRTSLFSSNAHRSSNGIENAHEMTNMGPLVRGPENVDIADSNLEECAYFGSQVVNVASPAGDREPHQFAFDGNDITDITGDVEPSITRLPFFDCSRCEQDMLIRGTWVKEARRVWGCIARTSASGRVSS